MTNFERYIHPCRECGLMPRIQKLKEKWYIVCLNGACPSTVSVIASTKEEGLDIWNNLNPEKSTDDAYSA